MLCPKCGRGTQVYDTRRREDGAIFRRRQCFGQRCYMKFTTLERLATVVPKRKRMKHAMRLVRGPATQLPACPRRKP